MTMSRLPNTGEAVIIDLGEARDIHQEQEDAAAPCSLGPCTGVWF